MRAAFALTQREDLARGGVSEGLQMTLDIIRSASRHLYIETQYLASQTIAKALAARLLEDEGPEIVIICTRSSHGFIEQLVMGRNRRRVIRRLKQADRHDRLRVFYPVVPDDTSEIEVLVHSKLLIADDQSLRIGSSNLNHRSEGLDTECDMRLDATTPDHFAAIAKLRCQLLAEHLGTSTEIVAAKVDEAGSLIRAIDALNEGLGRLKALDADVGPGPLCPVIGTALFDPKTA
jgi:phospholipase D1/2